MSASNCIFCKIGAGAIPSLKVLETEDALAFLDIGPLAPGHILLIPKTHHVNMLDAPAETAAQLGAILPRLCQAVMRATGAAGVNVLHNAGAVAGQAVFHLHVHIIPRVDGDRLGYRWEAGRYAPGEGEAWRDRILAEVNQGESGGPSRSP